MANYRSYLGLLDELYLLNSSKKMKLGLERAELLHRALGSPSKHYKILHVAGTNGKGSVCFKAAEGLMRAGFSVGLFTSPHISCYRERIRVNGEMIAEEEVVEGLSEIFEMGGEPTFFEVTTLLALLHFRKKRVDWAVLETGLGGRLDATNIVMPELSVITTIGYDHCQLLGDTLEAITAEKAGIAKPGVPLLIGPKVPRHYIHKVDHLEVVEGPFSHYEEENRAIAKRALAMLSIPLSDSHMRCPPCRFERVFYRGKEFILDVAHNPQGLQCLFSRLGQEEPFVIVAMSRGKDIAGSLLEISKAAKKLHLVSTNHKRLATAEELLAAAPKGCTLWHGSLKEAVEMALLAESTAVICGSFFIMEEARALLGIEEARDALDMNEAP